MALNPKAGDFPGADLRRLARRDPFESIRSDEELAQLVAETARKSARPYSQLLNWLVGTPAALEADEARRFWFAAVENRRAMSSALGRRVHLRVAALDLLTRPSASPRLKPALLERSVLDELVTSATTDAMTGAVNRKTFLSLLAHDLLQRREKNCVVSMLDLDGFKAVNDTHGHARGDEVLRQLVRSASRFLRRGDVLARIGGDEFAILFNEATESNAEAILERIEAAFRDVCGGLEIGISSGVAAPRKNESAEALLDRADAGMYRHKRARKAAPPPALQRERIAPAVVYATTSAIRLVEVSGRIATWGHLVIPATSPEALRSLVSLLKPELVVADRTFPPLGGEAAMRALPSTAGRRTMALVAPRHWAQRSRSTNLPVLPFPAGPNGIDAILPRLLQDRYASALPIGDEAMARALLRSITGLVQGRRMTSEDRTRLTGRAEIDLVRRVLGG